MELTINQKLDWLKKASNEELLKQLCKFTNSNSYGCNDEDIKLTREEILKRMNGGK